MRARLITTERLSKLPGRLPGFVYYSTEIDLSSKLAIEAAKQLKLVNDSTEESA